MNSSAVARTDFELDARTSGCQSKLGLGELTTLLDGQSQISEDVGRLNVRGLQLVGSVDVIRPFLRDPVAFGRAAFVHSLADISASLSDPIGALAIALTAEGDEPAMKQAVQAAMCLGRDLGCPVLGGHTMRVDSSALGFSLMGVASVQAPPIDLTTASWSLVLTKPLGCAKHVTACEVQQTTGEHYGSALRQVLMFDHEASRVLRRFQALAATDVSGFGLGIHASNLAARAEVAIHINWEYLPFIPPRDDFSDARTCLWDKNIAALETMPGFEVRRSNRWQCILALAMPQVCGGLLGLIPAVHSAACISALQGAGYDQARVIGASQASARGLVLT